MNLKKNIAYNSLLTLSNYILPIIVYPYVSRILGVTNIGIYNFIDSIVNYAILLSMLGINILGVREIAKCKNDHDKEIVFSKIFTLHTFSTTIILIIFLITVFTIPKFIGFKNLFLIGSSKILLSLFIVEWYFKGIENFKYITIRSIIVKVFYVISIFIFIKEKEDYSLYYILSVISFTANAAINWNFLLKHLKPNLSLKNTKDYIVPFISLGLYMIFSSFYTSFNIAYLGFCCGENEVGYYTTATKLYSIILSLFTAFTSVMLPRISQLIVTNSWCEINKLIEKSFNILISTSIPIIIFFTFYAHETIYLIAGRGFELTYKPFLITLPLILIIGIEQIFIIQLLMPMKKDKSILINSFIGAIIGVLLNILIVPYYKSTGSALVWLCSEIAVLLSAYLNLRKINYLRINMKLIYKIAFLSTPYLLLCWISKSFTNIVYINMLFAVSICIIYFIIIQVLILKNENIVNLFNHIKIKISKK